MKKHIEGSQIANQIGMQGGIVHMCAAIEENEWVLVQKQRVLATTNPPLDQFKA